MEQYIKKAAIVAEIDSWRDGIKKGIFSIPLTGSDRAYATFEYEILGKVKDLLDTLEVKEVDLEKELKRLIGNVGQCDRKLAKHFFELGLNSQTKDMREALRMEYEKGRADVLRCIDPDEMVADFCSQTLSKTRSIASIYRQGIIDIIKRINRNEETSITSTHSIDDGGVQLPKP